MNGKASVLLDAAPMPLFKNGMPLALQLRTMNRALDRIVGEPHSDSFETITQAVVEQTEREDIVQAVQLLETTLESNPFWLRGYLLLGTVYQHAQQIGNAIATIQNGLTICTNSLRLFESKEWLGTVERINGPTAHDRTARNADRLRRYEYILRHRLALLQVGIGSFDDALKQWAEIEDEHCA